MTIVLGMRVPGIVSECVRVAWWMLILAVLIHPLAGDELDNAVGQTLTCIVLH